MPETDELDATSDTENVDTDVSEAETHEESDPDGADKLGDAGKKALDAMKAQRKAALEKARAAQEEAESLRAQLAAKDKSPEQQALDEARSEGRKEAKATSDARIVRLSVKAAAAGKLADPSDALAFIDLKQFEVDDDGEVDSDALNEAIADLIAKKPHLAAGAQNRFQGGGDGGARQQPKPDPSFDEQIQAAEKARNFPLVATLKQQRYAAEQAKKG